MSFASEVAAYKSSPGKEAAQAAAVTATPTETVAPPPAAPPVTAPEMPKHGDVYDPAKFDFNAGLPPGAAPVDPGATAGKETAGAKAVATPPSPPTANEAVVPAPKIRIGDQEFQTIDEATRYAEKLLAEKAQNDAYVEGVKDATKKPEEPPPEDPYKKLAESFSKKVFENPEEAAAELIRQTQAMTEASIEAKYKASLAQQRQAEEQARVVQQTREQFYKDNPDLSAPEMREYIQETLLPHMTKKGTLKPTADLKETAIAIRKQLEIMRVATLPAKELPSGPVTMTGATGEATSAAAAAPAEEKMDFVTQLLNMKKRKAK
jgi:hypothetical protein